MAWNSSFTAIWKMTVLMVNKRRTQPRARRLAAWNRPFMGSRNTLVCRVAAHERSKLLHDELRELDKQLTRLTKLAGPRLLARFGVGPQTAATLLVTAGDNPTRLRVVMLIRLVTLFCPRRTIRWVANYVRQRVSSSSIFDAAMRRAMQHVRGARTRHAVVGTVVVGGHRVGRDVADLQLLGRIKVGVHDCRQEVVADIDRGRLQDQRRARVERQGRGVDLDLDRAGGAVRQPGGKPFNCELTWRVMS